MLAAPAVVALGVLETSCGTAKLPNGLGPRPVESPSAVRSASDLARDRAVSAERGLLALYDAALALPSVIAVPALSSQLSAVRAEHAAHLAAARQGYVTAPPASATPSASPSVSATPTASAADAKTTVLGLVRAEQDASARLTDDVLIADGATAQVLASIAASEAGHAALLLGGTA